MGSETHVVRVRKNRRKPKPFKLQLTKGESAILASFVFCPMGTNTLGRTGSLIARTNLRLFYPLFKFPVRDNGRIPWQANVTLACRRLQRQGYLAQTGTAQWTAQRNPSEGPQSGTSPLFNLSESGTYWVLANCDEQYLPPAKDAMAIYQDRQHRIPPEYDELNRQYINGVNLERFNEENYRTVADQSYQSGACTDWRETLYRSAPDVQDAEES